MTLKLDCMKIIYMIKISNKKITLLYTFQWLVISLLSAQVPQYGLKFNGYSYEPEMRTSLDLSPKGHLSFPNGFSMSFDVKFDFNEIHSYGYVFRICDKKERTIDFVFGEKNVSFSSTINDIVFSSLLPDIDLKLEEWVKIKVDIDVDNEKLKFQIGHTVKEWKNLHGLRDFKKVDIVFGKNNYSKTQAIDVPDMTIKNIKIDDLSGNSLYYWKLAKYVPDGVYDEIEHQFAQCENPNWVLTCNATWNKEITFTCERYPYIAINQNHNVVSIADQHYFYSYSLSDRQLRKQIVLKGFSYPRYANQMIYNPIDSSYYVYNLVKEEDGREFTAFDSIKNIWGSTTAHNHFSDYWHHNRYFSKRSKQLFVIGGYGHHKYKEGTFVYDIDKELWTKKSFKGDTIEPRYLSGLGKIADDKLLLFGGYGSKTGNQEISPQHYYDAFEIDVKSMTSKKLWTLEAPEENFVVSNSIVVDTANNCFYALCYPFTKYNTAIRLYKFSLDKPEYEILADTIPFGFKDSFSYVDLFFDSSENSLMAITSSSPLSVDSIASISVYSLAYPPMKKTDLFQEEDAKSGLLFWLLSTLGVLIVLSLIFYLYKSRKSKLAPQKIIDEEITTDNISMETVNRINTVKTLRKQSIFLFGGFQVIDRDGNDLTSEFKPLIKNLFLLILLNTIKNGKGISFIKLKELLWFDKSEESANNNRGVAMSKIRQVFESIGEAKFNKQGSYWSLEFGEEIYCDYYEALLLIKKIKQEKRVEINDLKKLLAIASEGELLPNLQVDWADSFKSDFSNDFVDLLLDLIDKEDESIVDSVYLDIANAIFIHDPLNEDALKLKCKTLVKMGKNGLARNAYTTFIKEYHAWFDSNYKFTFDQVIS